MTTTRRKNLKKDGALHPNPEKVKSELFWEGTFFNPEDLAQVKYEMLRSVQMEKLSITKASKKFGLSRPSYYQSKKQFEKDGITGLIPLKPGPKHAHKLSDDVMLFVKEQLDLSGGKDWKKISQLVYEKFKKRVHPRSIERSIRLEKKTRARR
jgi:transposase